MPPQVISLLSSPVASPPQLPPQRQSAPRARNASPRHRQRGLPFLPDDIDSSLLEYVDYESPATKKRRLSPDAGPNAVGNNNDALPPSRSATVHKEAATVVLSEDAIESDIHAPGQLEQSCNINARATLSLWSDELSDPILCSSSAPEPRSGYTNENRNNGGLFNGNNTKSQDREVITLDDSVVELEDGLSAGGKDEVPDLSQPSGSQAQLSSRTATLLASIKNPPASNSARGPGRPPPFVPKSRAGRDGVDIPSDEDLPSHARGKQKRTAQATSTDKAAKAVEREQAKRRREQEKAETKERKQKLKEEKQKQKQLAADIAEVNKSKMDKKVSTPEMIVDVSESLKDTSVGNQVGEFMRHLGVQTHFLPTQMPNVVSWRRKVAARYNEEALHWEPCPLTIEREGHVLCLVRAQEFVDLAVSSAGDSSEQRSSSDLEDHVLKLLSCFPSSKPIYLIEGLSTWMKKNQNSRNRAYQAAVRRQISEELNQGSDPRSASNTSGRRSKKPDAPPVDDDAIEDALLQLQVNYNCLIHHASSPAESAEWIKNFTEHISTIPYRHERMNLRNAGFCMDVGQVKTGDDPDDTYVKMLQEIQRVTAPMAHGIATQFRDVTELSRAMKQEGPLMLQDVKKCVNTRGELSDSRIGPAVSKRLHRVFTGLDPNATDI